MHPVDVRKRRVAVACLGILLALAGRSEAADPTPKEIRERIDAVSELIAMGKPDEARAALAVGIEGLRIMQSKPQLATGFKVLAGRATAARKALEKAGVDVASLEIPTVAAPVAAPAIPGPPQPAVAAGISFTRQVAPMLVRSCGGCHVSGRRGNFQMGTYQTLMQSGMVQRNAGNASRLVEVILTGDMPRGGGKVSPDDVGMLIAWIDRGATCDGDPTAGLDVLARGGATPPHAPVIPTGPPAPLKPGDVAFSSDVAPILIEKCGKCHGDRDPENSFSIATLTSMVKGGRSGPAIVPGKAEDSLLVKKLRGAGIEGQRMPLNAPPLPDADIATIAKWIEQGARIDLLTPTDPIEKHVATGKSRRLSNEALTEIRREAAEKLWSRMIPDESPSIDGRDGFVVIGNLPAPRLREIADIVDDVVPAIRRDLIGRGDEALLKGGVVLYAFRNSYDYSSLWQVVLDRERPKEISGNAGMAGDVIYGAVLVPSSGGAASDNTKLLLAEQLAGAVLVGRELPAWFCRGAGRAVAMKLVPKAPLVQEWKNDVGAAIKQLGSAKEFLAGHAEPNATAVAAGGFLSTLASAGKLAQVVALVEAGTTFDEAFARIFRSSPEQAFTAWAARNTGR